MEQLNLIDITEPGYYDFAEYSDLPDNFGILEKANSNYWDGNEQIVFRGKYEKTIQNV